MNRNYNNSNKLPRNSAQKGVVVSKINRLLEDLEEKITDAPGVLGFGIMKTDALIVLLNKVKVELPEEIDAANQIVQKKDALIADTEQKMQEMIDSAERRANDIVEAAQREADRLVGETYVMKKANQEANAAILDANSTAKNAIEYANNYVAGAFDSILKGIDFLQEDTMKKKDSVLSQMANEEGRYSVALSNSYENTKANNSSKNNSSRYDDDEDDLGDFKEFAED